MKPDMTSFQMMYVVPVCVGCPKHFPNLVPDRSAISSLRSSYRLRQPRPGKTVGRGTSYIPHIQTSQTPSPSPSPRLWTARSRSEIRTTRVERMSRPTMQAVTE